MTITVSTRLITWMLTVAVILLTAAGVAGQFWEHGLGQDRFVEFVRLFDPDAEANVPTWFSSLLLLLAAALLAAMARAKHVRRDPFTPLWIALAMVFAGLSVDEFASVHELLDRVVLHAQSALELRVAGRGGSRDAQALVSLELDTKDSEIKTGDFVQLNSDELLEPDGTPLSASTFQAVRREKKKSTIALTLQRIVSGTRICFICPNEDLETPPDPFPGYASASDLEKEYGFITENTGLLPNGDPGYIIW